MSEFHLEKVEAEAVAYMEDGKNAVMLLCEKLRERDEHNAILRTELNTLAEAAELMLELLVDNKPIEGLFLSNIEEWQNLIDEAKS